MRKAAVILFATYVCSIGFAVQARASGITKHDRQVIRFFQHHPRLAATPAGGRILAKLLPRVIRSLQAAAATPAWPTHHALWTCIASYESGGNWGNQDTGGNGHYGGLQMHPGWGYGTSYYASQDSEFVQEQAAERGYAASGYSHAFLAGQWGQTIGPCWSYA